MNPSAGVFGHQRRSPSHSSRLHCFAEAWGEFPSTMNKVLPILCLIGMFCKLPLGKLVEERHCGKEPRKFDMYPGIINTVAIPNIIPL